MKRGLVCSAALAVVTAAVLAPRVSTAKCMYRRMQAFPRAGVHLPLNGRIVVEGYGADEDLVKDIAVHHPELWSAGDRVPLRAAAMNVGGFNITQVVLVPERQLLPKTKYTLRIYAPERPASDDSEEKTRETFTWTTGASTDRAAPRWQAPPRAADRVYRELGCGPEAYVTVHVPVADAQPVQVLAEVRPAGGGPTARYLLQPQEGAIQIGHDMCSGPFQLADKGRYDVTLTAFDAAGNASPAPGPTLQIVAPSPKDATP